MKSKSEDSSSIYIPNNPIDDENDEIISDSFPSNGAERPSTNSTRKRHVGDVMDENLPTTVYEDNIVARVDEKQRSWRRILLLIVAITVHNIPGKRGVHFFQPC